MTAAEHWEPYTPDANAPWDLRRVVHIHRRAGFAGNWGELQRDLRGGHRATIDRFLAGTVSARVPEGFAATAGQLADAAVAAGDVNRLRAAWFYRLVFGPDPLREHLVLLWHSHFATAYTKVRDVGALWRQNELFRRLARSSFTELAAGAVRDPALLLYLDASSNRRGHPNENLAREMMELFTLGIGNFTEDDVKEAARALTGWSVEEGQFTEVPARHDDGEKTILTKRGRFNGDDLMRIVLEHEATSMRLAGKLCEMFLGETAVPAEAVQDLAAGLRSRRLDVGWAVETILRSKRFFAAENLGNRVLGPVEFIAGAVRALELVDPAPSTLALADWAARMGQALFDPPNVAGWPGERDWINPRSMLLRSNFATALLGGNGMGRPQAYDPVELARRQGAAVEAGVGGHFRLLLGIEPSAERRQRVAGLPARQAVAMLLASPECQLG